MKERDRKNSVKNRDDEKGAALVMVLMISFLLLVASAGLLMEVSMNTANVTDATAEQQAYNAAESGIQSAINVMRGNTQPTSSPTNDTITFSKAVKLASSNLPGDTSTNARLSRWGLTYNYPASNPDRVAFGAGSGTYAPNTGYAFKVAVSDPDNTGSLVTFTTTNGGSGLFDSASSTWKRTLTIGSGSNTVTITYNPATISTVDVSSGTGSTKLGNFQISATGSVTLSSVPFQIVLDMSDPYIATRVIRGQITGATSNGSIGSVKFDFNASAFELMGSIINVTDPLNASVGKTDINVTMTPPEPQRLLIRSTGFGPRGARKQLEAILQKNFFEGLSAPAALTLVGSTSGFVFNAGNSANVNYSGDDVAPGSNLRIPSIGTTNTTNLNYVNNNPPKTKPDPAPADVTLEMPLWLQNTYNLDATVRNLKGIANASGSYYVSGVTPANFGNNSTGQGITFADGDVSLSGAGGGILICTGTLTLNGNVNFNGLIIVTGSGGLTRHGGGNGTLQGNTVIAPYDPNNLAAGYLGPKYDISGGGNSTLIFNSNSVANGLMAVSNIAIGVAEK